MTEAAEVLLTTWYDGFVKPIFATETTKVPTYNESVRIFSLYPQPGYPDSNYTYPRPTFVRINPYQSPHRALIPDTRIEPLFTPLPFLDTWKRIQRLSLNAVLWSTPTFLTLAG